jgi:hypothetical protein
VAGVVAQRVAEQTRERVEALAVCLLKRVDPHGALCELFERPLDLGLLGDVERRQRAEPCLSRAACGVGDGDLLRLLQVDGALGQQRVEVRGAWVLGALGELAQLLALVLFDLRRLLAFQPRLA